MGKPGANPPTSPTPRGDGGANNSLDRSLKRRFDAFRLAATGDAIEGTLEPREVSRLAERIADTGLASAGLATAAEGGIAWRIRGSRDEAGRPAIEVSIQGSVPMTCQRCLDPVDQPVQQVTTLLLARNEAELVSLDEASAHEVVLAKEPLDAVGLVEDELLLTLPFVPRHEACPATGVDSGDASRDADR